MTLLSCLAVLEDIIATDRCSGLVVEYRTRNREVAGSTHTRSTASNLEQVAKFFFFFNPVLVFKVLRLSLKPG